MSSGRRDELAERVAGVRERVARAAAAAGRSADDVSMVVVTKTWPSSDIRLLHELGVTDFAENRSQEGETKAAELADLPITWHFIGQIQSNKASRIAGYASVVHSVDSVRVAHRLNSGAERAERSLECLVQVSLDPAADASGRGGVRPGLADEIAEALEAAEFLRFAGVMGVAPLHEDSTLAYRRLAEVAAQLRLRHPDGSLLSAGMSADFEAAIRVGATHVRVGSAILGLRPPNR